MKWLCYILIILIVGCQTVCAQYKVLLNFNGQSFPEGTSPSGFLTRAGNRLFGMTFNGGAQDKGCVFSIDTNGSGYKDILDFNDTNGSNPSTNSFILLGNRLYGMTNIGGAYGDGVIFSIDTNGGGYKKLFDFNGTKGAGPAGALIISGGILFGATMQGGAGNGVVFCIDTDGNKFKVLHNFNSINGEYPWNSLVILKGVLYGITSDGGAHSDGIIFSVDTSGNGFRDLYDFNGAYGQSPRSSLTISGSLLFGTTNLGGAFGEGIIYSIDTSGNNFRDLLDFDGTNGDGPENNYLMLSGSKLFGTTIGGGVNNDGVIFSIDTSGKEYKDLYDFNLTGGATPDGGLLLSGGMLYGLANAGGANGDGTVYSLDTSLTTSINQLTIESGGLQVFPNPSSGRFTFYMENIAVQPQLVVYNLMGETIYRSALTVSNNRIDLSKNSSGIYLYRIISENGELISAGKLILK